MDFIIRDVATEDLDEILKLNEEVVPAVNSIPIDKMQWFAVEANYFRVALKGERLAGFLIGLRPGSTYESENYRWFCDKYDDFAYIDRIAIAAHARRQGLATVLYDDFRSAFDPAPPRLVCEVNTVPLNESSLTFHERYGFAVVGSRAYDGDTKEVALLAKPL
jgi:predicted GNAT superfamily acetyltransferase